jgi:hypothetical protein
VPRFVILEHDWPQLHWDLLLEAGPVLRAWRLLDEPGPGRTVAAQTHTDHRLLYLEYEGPVSGGRGTVRQWDAGTFNWIEDGERVVILLQGAKLTGHYALEGHAHGLQFGKLA